MAQENICNKYGITKAELKKGIDIISSKLGMIGNVNVLLAVTELLCNADIDEDNQP
jgi:hypothetical protein